MAADTAVAASTDRRDPPPGRGRIRLDRVALAVCLAPLVVAAVVLVVVGGDLLPAHDIAQLEMRTRDVGRYEVLLGPYSRDGWYHPGPAQFYLLAIPYRLAGASSVGIYLGAVAVNAGAVAGMALIARRLAGRAVMLVTLLASAVLLVGLGPDLVRDPWNPSITVLPYGALVFLTWAMTCGERWALPASAVVATFLAQTHVGFVVLALPLVAWGAAWLVAIEVVRRRRAGRAAAGAAGDGGVDAEEPAAPEADVAGTDADAGGTGRTRRGMLRPLLLTGVALALLWAPPVVQQTTGDWGNLGKALFYFQHRDEPGLPLSSTLRILSDQLAVPPAWTTGLRSTSLSLEPLALYGPYPWPVLLLPLVAAVVVVWRRGPVAARRFLLCAAAAVALGVVAIGRTTGVAYTYRLHWTSVLGMLTGVIAGWAVWLVVHPRLDPAGVRRLAAATVGALVAVSAVGVVQAGRAGVPEERFSDPLAAVVPDAVDHLHAAGDLGDAVVVVQSSSYESLLLAPGVALALEKAGVPARLPALSDAPGDHRILAEDDDVAFTLHVAVNGEVAAARGRADLVEVASWGEIPPPRRPDDPAVQAEAAFVAGAVEAERELGEAYLDELDVVRFPIDAVGLFVETGR